LGSYDGQATPTLQRRAAAAQPSLPSPWASLVLPWTT